MKTIEPTRELIPLKLIEPWARNPRGGELREMESFTEQLRMEGIREDVHVFRDAQGVLRLMQGHRRREAAGRLGLEALWAKVWPFDESEAFLHLITMQQGADPFDARELAKASRTAMEMGIEKERLIGVMHRSAETVQLYLDLGTLPHRVQEAVYRGKLALGTAGLMRQLSKEQMELAMDGVLNNPITQEAMTEGQARVYIENQFLKPERWRREWEVLCLKVKRKLVAGGMDGGLVDVVQWEDREQFVMSEALPQSAYALCEEHIEDGLLVKPGEPMTWGALALSLGVPWHVAPAMARTEKHVLVVKVSAVKDADSTSAEKVLRGRGKNPAPAPTPTPARSEGGGEGDGGGEVDGGGEGDGVGGGGLKVSESHGLPVSESAFDEVRWRKVHGALMLKPEAAMQNALWEALMGTQWEALVEILPSESYASLMGELNRDGVKRKGLRWCLLACVALALCAEDEEGLSVVEGALGTAG
jgi:ParB-like chromosome segregation protein Spo0J